MDKSLLPKLSVTPQPNIDLSKYFGNNKAPRENPRFYRLEEEFLTAQRNYRNALVQNMIKKGSVSEKEMVELIETYNSKLIIFYNLPSSPKITALREAEIKIAKEIRVCRPEQIDFITAALPRPNVSTFLSDAIYYSRHNQRDLKKLSCLTETMNNSNIASNKLENFLLHRWIVSAQRIGTKSAMGTAFALKNREGETLFVAKVANDDEDPLNEVAHEAVIGMLAVNPVGNKVPNFVHTYGVYSCHPPIIDFDTQDVDFCPSSADGSNIKKLHLIIENVAEAYNMKELVGEIDAPDFVEIYLQIVNALNVAYNMNNFTHYDLHAENVLIQKLVEPISIPIYFKDKTKYLITNYLVKIIDYGLAYASIQGYDIGSYDAVGIVPAESAYQIYDAYKYLFFTGLACKNLKNPTMYTTNIYNIVEYIYKSNFAEYPEFKYRLALYGSVLEDYGQPIHDLTSLRLENLLNSIAELYDEYHENDGLALLDDEPEEIPTLIVSNGNDIFVALANDIVEVDNIIDFATTANATNRLPDSIEKEALLEKISNVDVRKLFNEEVIFMGQRISQDRSPENVSEIRLWTVAAHYALKYKKIEDKDLYDKIAEIAQLAVLEF